MMTNGNQNEKAPKSQKLFDKYESASERGERFVVCDCVKIINSPRGLIVNYIYTQQSIKPRSPHFCHLSKDETDVRKIIE